MNARVYGIAGVAVLGAFAFLSVLLLSAPPINGAGMEADSQCIPATPVCGCGMVMGPKGCIGGANKYLCPCIDHTNGGTVAGTCQANFKCQGNSFSGAGMQGMMGLLQSLLKPGGSNGGGNSATDATLSCSDYASGSGTTSLSGNCQNSTSSLYASTLSGGGTTLTDTSISGIFGDSITSLLGTDSGTDTLSILRDESNEPITKTVSVTASTSIPISPTSSALLLPLNAGMQISAQGASGNVVADARGVTIVGSVTDSTGNSATAGFWGIPVSSSNTVQSLASQLCKSRPWANALISIIPPSLFDGLCQQRGL